MILFNAAAMSYSLPKNYLKIQRFRQKKKRKKEKE